MDYDKMNKNELIEENNNLQQIILDLQKRLESSKSNDSRKSQVLELLRSNSSISILEMAESLNVSTKNISSQLTYLRTDGYQIFTDPKGRKVLVEEKAVEVVEDVEDAENIDDFVDEDDTTDVDVGEDDLR